MPKNRYSLEETMTDVVKGIQEAKTAPDMKEDLQDESAKEGFLSPVPEQDGKPVSATPETDAACEERKPVFPKAGKGKHGRPKGGAVSKDERYVRNVFLDKKTLWKLEQVKNRMNNERISANRGRSKDEKDPFVSIASLLNLAAQEFLDRHYPSLEEAYRMIHGE